MYSVFCVAPLVEVVYKGLILMQQYSKVEGQALVLGHTQHCFGLILDFKLYCYNIYLVPLNYSTLLLLH